MLSKKTQYALQALSYMVGKGTDAPILIAEISTEKKIPLKFLEVKKENMADTSLRSLLKK